MTSSAVYLAGNLRITLGYAEMLVKDIPHEKFALKPFPTMNHPQWIFGHLSLYPDRGLEMMGRSDIALPDERYTQLFGAGTECSADGSIYPPPDEILARFRDRHEALLAVLPEIGDDILEGPTPNERYAQRFPKVGHVIHFLFANHIMSHLGQVSAWRRCVGLPSAM